MSTMRVPNPTPNSGWREISATAGPNDATLPLSYQGDREVRYRVAAVVGRGVVDDNRVNLLVAEEGLHAGSKDVAAVVRDHDDVDERHGGDASTGFRAPPIRIRLAERPGTLTECV
jgi:hypothetical protein